MDESLRKYFTPGGPIVFKGLLCDLSSFPEALGALLASRQLSMSLGKSQVDLGELQVLALAVLL